MAELADALDLESSSTRVQVQVLFRAPADYNGLIFISSLLFFFIYFLKIIIFLL